MIPRVAIHRGEGSFSDRWIEYCAEHGVAHEVVNCYDSGILGRDGFLGQGADDVFVY